MHTTKTPNFTADYIKELRVRIRQVKNTLPINGPSRYNAMVYTSLEKAAMWLGDVLSVLGEEYPYKPGELGPIADDTDAVLVLVSTRPSEQIGEVRGILRELTHAMLLLYLEPQPKLSTNHAYFKLSIAVQSCYQHLREASLDLGMELRSALQNEQVSHGKLSTSVDSTSTT